MSEEYFKLKCENGCEYKIPTHHTITNSTFVDCRYCDGKIVKKTKVTEDEVEE